MIRLAHFSDSHLSYRNGAITEPGTGRNQRAVDVETAFLMTCQAISEAAPDVVIHSGDWFHAPKPSWDAVECFIRGVRMFEGIPVVGIAGNHDVGTLRESSTVFDVLRSALPGITLVTGYEPLSVEVGESTVVHCLPHLALKNGAGVAGAFWPKPDAHNILVVHGMAANLPTLGDKEPGETEVGDELLADQWSYVAMGHWHRHGRVRERAWYAGATERMGFSDEPCDPGWNLVTLGEPGAEPVVERMATPARPMLTLPEVHAGLSADWSVVKDKLAASLNAVPHGSRSGSNVRIPIRSVSLRNRSLAKEWLRQQDHGYWSASIALGKERAKTVADRASDRVEVEAVALPSLGALFAAYVETLKHPPEIKAALLEHGGAALARAAEVTQEAE